VAPELFDQLARHALSRCGEVQPLVEFGAAESRQPSDGFPPFVTPPPSALREQPPSLSVHPSGDSADLRPRHDHIDGEPFLSVPIAGDRRSTGDRAAGPAEAAPVEWPISTARAAPERAGSSRRKVRSSPIAGEPPDSPATASPTEATPSLRPFRRGGGRAGSRPPRAGAEEPAPVLNAKTPRVDGPSASRDPAGRFGRPRPSIALDGYIRKRRGA
jgi:hypothetical protein